MNSSLWLIAYDIADPKRWRKVFRLLKSYGAPVQLSVFECRISNSQRQKLWSSMQHIVHSDEDKVLCYPVCGQCERRIMSLGNSKRSEKLPVAWVVSDGG